MPSSLVSARIRGIRSYSPQVDREQVIEFMPLTLIVGSNGTGKTSIIEALKFIISGTEPPHSDSRRNFIHEPKDEKSLICNSPEYASIELSFKDPSGQLCIARRQISRAVKTATPNTTSSYKIGGRAWTHVNRQDDWGQIMPRLFGLPNQAILNNIILCHQEENLWCMGESAKVKEVFDKIFGCEEYKKEIKYIDDETRNTKKDQLLLQKDLDNLREKVLRKNLISEQIKEMELELRKISADVISINAELENLVEKKKKLSDIMESSDRKSREVDRLKQRIRELTERDSIYRKSLQTFSIKRPAPPVPSAIKYQPLKKKPAPDPTASDLEMVVNDFGKMLKVLDSMPVSNDLASLRELIEKALQKIQSIKKRFDVQAQEPVRQPSPPPRVEEETDIEEQVSAYRREIEDNINKNLEELESIRSSIATLQGETSHCLQQPSTDKTKDDMSVVDRDLVLIRDKRSTMLGTKNQMERELNRLRSELSSYQRVNVLYSESLGKVVCNKIILEDLEKLKACFLESITTFHDQMFVKINDLLRRRWKMIYQGKDIESIELVEEEITRGKDKKSYNYHMAMRKDGKRMKMREKSSAGQRALAAILLRMTIAELFVKDFAFIALDEPTANLDISNVQALAKSIGTYVRKRNKLGINIQWIIITHDEQFLRALDEECSPYFYRIQVDPRDRCSNIVKISCHDSGINAEKFKGTVD